MAQNFVEILKDFFVLIPNHVQTRGCKVLFPASIVGLLVRFSVNISIDFNDQSPFGTIKVDNERPNPMLPPKLQVLKSPSPQFPPKCRFGRCHFAA